MKVYLAHIVSKDEENPGGANMPIPAESLAEAAQAAQAYVDTLDEPPAELVAITSLDELMQAQQKAAESGLLGLIEQFAEHGDGDHDEPKVPRQRKHGAHPEPAMASAGGGGYL
ncbi:MAG TPA: hypothetical protein VIU37_05030 [Candidatus Limnocylindrales bacterium]